MWETEGEKLVDQSNKSSQLPKVLGLLSIIAFGLTNEIASGLFFLTTQVQVSAPGTGSLVPLLMLVGGLVIILSVIIYRFFFASGLFGAGGEYIMISQSISRPVAFWATFISWFGATAVMGTLASVAPLFLANAFDGFGMHAAAQFCSSKTGTLIIGLALIWGFWAIHVTGVRIAGLLATISMFLVVIVALLLMFLGFATTPESLGSALSAKLHMSLPEVMNHASVQSTNFKAAFVGALPVLFFGYLGLSTATQTGGEAKNVRKDLPLAVLITVLTVTVIYTLFSIAVYHAIPWQLVTGLNALGLKSYTTASGLLGLMLPDWANALLGLAIALIVAKTFIPVFLAQSRWVYAWAEAGIIPKGFAKLHHRFGTPVRALTIGVVLSSISLIETLKMGVSFGASERVLAAMLVFICLGVGMWIFPHRNPILYKQNDSWLAKRRGLQIVVAFLMIAVSFAFVYSIVVSSLKQPFFLQPAVQLVMVSVVSGIIYLYSKKKSPNLGINEEATLQNKTIEVND
jgi:basic amino acid/polyamine antiporter, APA family